jgi:Mn-dependent DtxR family transcriptional regulator
MITKEYYGPVLKQLLDYTGNVTRIARRAKMSIPIAISRLEDLQTYGFIDSNTRIRDDGYVTLTDAGRKRAKEMMDAT